MTPKFIGSKPMIASGKINSALYLNGLNYLIINEFNKFVKDEDKLKEFTIDFWFKVNDMSIG